MTAISTRRAFLEQMPAGVAALQSGASRPNLVFVFSDQQSRDMLGCYGNRQIVTPHLDRFAARSVRFEHCVSNSPVCTPYRGMLLSGLHPLENGAIENDIRALPGNGNYFGEVLRDAGYRLGYIGKWHLYGGDHVRPIPPGPYRYGFDHTFLSNNCTLAYDEKRAYYWDADGRRQLYGEWEPYAQTRQAMRFLDDNADRPFALFLSWHPPHNWVTEVRQPGAGYAAPPDLMRLYDPAAIRLRGNCLDTPQARAAYQGHMALCTSIDRSFGWLIGKLEEKGLAANTIVVFTSDHGDTLLSHGFRHNKMRPEIESIGVPLLLRYPGVLKPRVSQLPVGTLDLMPTLLALMGLRPPASCQGRNLAQAILRAHDNEVDSVPLFLFPLDWRGVYTRRYTYSIDTNRGGWCPYRAAYFRQPENLRWNCLYDRQADPWEHSNLFDSAELKKVRRRLDEQTRTWMKRFGDGGWSYETMARSLYSESDIEHLRAGRFMRISGLLKGRPAGVLMQ